MKKTAGKKDSAVPPQANIPERPKVDVPGTSMGDMSLEEAFRTDLRFGADKLREGSRPFPKDLGAEDKVVLIARRSSLLIQAYYFQGMCVGLAAQAHRDGVWTTELYERCMRELHDVYKSFTP